MLPYWINDRSIRNLELTVFSLRALLLLMQSFFSADCAANPEERAEEMQDRDAQLPGYQRGKVLHQLPLHTMHTNRNEPRPDTG